jgi:F-type H+-transporting ATPase subunit delta
MADSFDKQLDVADSYSQALFELASEAGKIDEIREELDELVAAAERMEDPLVREFFTSRALDDDVRERLMEKTLRGKIDDLTLNTLLVLNANGRHGLLPALRRCYVLRQEAAAGQVEATATTAVELDDAQKAAVQDTAVRLSGKKPLIDYRVEPDILGGLILQIGDLRFDNSLRTQLLAARERLFARSERGLEISVDE